MIETTARTHQCPSCRAAVAEDQSYCLSCGARQPGARTRGEAPAAGSVPSAPELGPSAVGPARDWTPVVALGGLAALALVLVIGVLIGRSGQSPAKTAGAPQVIQLQGGGTGAATPSSAGTGGGSAAAVGKITDEWPAGKSGWTVALQTLAKSGATPGAVAAAKASAAGKGAKNVGVLDASNYTSLGSGYVIYSGVFSSQAQANAALAKLKQSFSGAKVVHVVQAGGSGGAGAASPGAPPSAAQQQAGAAAIQSLTNCSGAACSKAARKITQPIATPGTAPKKDNKAAGGGGGGQSFQ